MSETSQMKMSMVTSLAELLIEQDSTMTMETALDIVFNSDTYQRIQDENTHFYYQSPRYVFAFLETELKRGKIE